MMMRVERTRVLSIACAALLAMAAPAAGQLAARPAAEWIKMLDSPERIANLRIDEIVAKLGLKPGDVVADLGAGSGAFSIPLARAVGPSGKVYAVEIDQELVDYIAEKAKTQNAANVRTVLGKFGDPSLPAADVDLAFMHDVLHHIKDRPGYLKNAVRYLEPGGRFAFVELDHVRGAHRDDPKLQVTKAQLTAWMADAGMKPVEEAQLSPEKWYVVYARQ
jgi:ubiquinone/menaquinone biosynthesis C-methylase UbiE